MWNCSILGDKPLEGLKYDISDELISIKVLRRDKLQNGLGYHAKRANADLSNVMYESRLA